MEYCVIVPSELSRGNEMVLNAMSSFDKYSHAMIQMSHQMGKVILTYNIAVAIMQIKIAIQNIFRNFNFTCRRLEKKYNILEIKEYKEKITKIKM